MAELSSGFDPTASCYIKSIPVLCSGAIIVDGEYTPATASLYSIAKLRTNVSSYDPTNAQLAAYNFQASDVKTTWLPGVYQISSGAIVSYNPGSVISSGSSDTGGVCAANGYNTSLDNYSLVTYYWTVQSAMG